jgi:hypothetical protein
VYPCEELAAHCLGYNPWEIGLQMHQVTPEPLLRKMGVHVEVDKKYLGMNGKEMGEPNKPRVLRVE